MHTDNVVIEEGGMRYVLGESDHPGCSSCKIRNSSEALPSERHAETCIKKNRVLCSVCLYLGPGYNCISATKIQPEPKMYFAWNREEARGLVGKVVEFHTGVCGSKWMTATLDCIDNAGSPFLSGSTFGKIIREAKTTKLTLAQLIEMAGIEGAVEIVEE